MAATELGAALRHWRDRVSPEAAGLRAGSRRRAAGLRREELSQLAGISVDYLTRLEHAAWTQLLANPLYTALMGDWQGDDLNAVWRTFLGAGTRVRHTPGSLGALRAAQVADLRRTAARYPSDRHLHHLIGRLRAESPEFETLWTSGAVGRHESARKTIDHPHVGAITLDCDVLVVAGEDLRMMVYTAEPGTEDADRLPLLSVLGTQELTGRLKTGPGRSHRSSPYEPPRTAPDPL
ncbi:hypothetical protein ABZW11_21525 [Nonomuraea sp. NPDC004580]|uniref:MmyB family transcriptional regulator n=1 Tax=Nonomuraea sp. NPDC004580 TaxID=3154552 RepID=UPI0033B89AD8